MTDTQYLCSETHTNRWLDLDAVHFVNKHCFNTLSIAKHT